MPYRQSLGTRYIYGVVLHRPPSRHLEQSTCTRLGCFPVQDHNSQSSQSISWLFFADGCFLSDWLAIMILTLREALLTDPTRYHESTQSRSNSSALSLTTSANSRPDPAVFMNCSFSTASLLGVRSSGKSFGLCHFAFDSSSWAVLCMAYRLLSSTFVFLLLPVCFLGQTALTCFISLVMLNRGHT
ncbi:hypothetical protein IFM46972_09177 [Aspergillus udagawae]|uniref:Uncharacterized protein n=1 Tax=Aspergillus udagawae TaxID=91492 RepID=A0A8H3S2N4_9EURO|nr:hypothetical protein IFM46972_09177 [Aspergillus udagawae]